MDFSTDFYKKLFTNLNSNAVLLKIDEKDRYEPVWIILCQSPSFLGT